MTVRRRVRQAQTIVPFGVGGIIDLRGESFVAADITTWGRHGREIESRRLAAKLGVQQFRAAPEAPDGKRQYAPNIPGPVYSRFPKWLFCPHCRLMTWWRSQNEEADRPPTCVRCDPAQKLVPMRFIQVCTRGHMSDVDWVRWAHSTGKTRDQQQCGRITLSFLVSGDSAGLGSLRIWCSTCRTHRSLAGITGADALDKVDIRCSGRQPWQRAEDAEECDESPRVVQRGASNVYFPVVHSAIDVPGLTDVSQHDNEAAGKVYDHKLWTDLSSAPTGPVAPMLRNLIAVQCGVTTEFVDELLKQHLQELSGGIILDSETTDLSQDEWEVFTAAQPGATPTPSKDILVTREIGFGVLQDDPDHLRMLDERVSKVVAVDQLREVRALEGFWRLRAEGEEGFVSVHPTATPSWLPAVAYHGEGVFLTLDEQRLQEWEHTSEIWNRVVEGLAPVIDYSLRRNQLRELTGPKLLPRYVLLHTLAHMLIRQLSFDCGYSAAALRERVYARGFPDGTDRRPQAGVLIYTAAGDSEGTLGGLVRQGEPPRLAEAFIRLLETGTWCSNDPLCGERNMSFASLNRAACHACVFLPETSCENGNILLDRALLVGTDKVPGFFTPVIEAAIEHSAREVSGR